MSPSHHWRLNSCSTSRLYPPTTDEWFHNNWPIAKWQEAMWPALSEKKESLLLTLENRVTVTKFRFCYDKLTKSKLTYSQLTSGLLTFDQLTFRSMTIGPATFSQMTWLWSANFFANWLNGFRSICSRPKVAKPNNGGVSIKQTIFSVLCWLYLFQIVAVVWSISGRHLHR